jgi:DNA helicase-2/ATP-dependent DNA helicase PcrA
LDSFSGNTPNGLALANFHTDAGGNLLYPDDAPGSDLVYIRQLEKDGHTPAELAGRAQTMIRNLTGSGIYDSERSRLRALGLLSDPSYGWLHKRIGVRFEEIIVDEFQDCSAIEHEILHRLTSLGIRVVVVADPDQAIYEFRQASPAAYSDYYNSLEPEQIVNLDENHRSSPAICSLISSLRSISTRPIISKREQTEDSRHADVVYAVVGSHSFARTQFERLANNLGIDAKEQLVLAPTRAAASALSGRPTISSDATKQSSKIVRNIAILRHSTDASSRKAAISTIEAVILGSIKFNDEIAKSSRDEQLKAAGIEQAELRVIVSRLVDSSTSWTTTEEAVSSIRAVLNHALTPISLGHTPVAVRFRLIDAADWQFWQQAMTTSGENVALAGAHIHSVKGGECDAVLLEIESAPRGSRPHVIDLWKSNETSEARRVLYVGASRARRLLVLAVPPQHQDSLRELFDNSDTPVEYIIEGE